MKTLIVSDIHLSHVFDKKKFLFLKELFSSVDQIILNGDFWDGYSTTFDRFVNSPWNQLFPLLKEKKAIYLYGNHDLKEFGDERVTLFSTIQKDDYHFKSGNIIYHVEHGHLLHTVKFFSLFSRKILGYLFSTGQMLEYILIIIGSPHNIFLKIVNKNIKKKLTSMKFPHWYVCGHTHYAEIDEKNKFINSGYIQFGRASYLIIDSSGLSLQTNRY